MKKKKIFLYAIPLLLMAYMGTPAVLSLLHQQKFTKQEMEKIMVIGHRGGASIGLENTISCYKQGIEAGADMIEIDIHLTKDNQIVVCHDHSVNRTTNGKGKIGEMTFDEVRNCKIKDTDGNLTDEKIPTIDEVFDLLQEIRSTGKPCQLLVEIKRTGNIYQGLEELLLEKISHYQAKEWVTVQSFDDSALEKMHQLDPTIRLEKLFFLKLPGLPFVIDWFHISFFSYEKYDYVSSFNMHYLWLTDSFLDEIHNHDKEVKIWTLEGPPAPHRNVDGIITNRPDLWKI